MSSVETTVAANDNSFVTAEDATSLIKHTAKLAEVKITNDRFRGLLLRHPRRVDIGHEGLSKSLIGLVRWHYHDLNHHRSP